MAACTIVASMVKRARKDRQRVMGGTNGRRRQHRPKDKRKATIRK
jgi:hypothetical protein